MEGTIFPPLCVEAGRGLRETPIGLVNSLSAAQERPARPSLGPHTTLSRTDGPGDSLEQDGVVSTLGGLPLGDYDDGDDVKSFISLSSFCMQTVV